jgi:L-iditol 2-dehydrogenase
METCRATVVVRADAPLEVRELPLPELEPGGVLVRVDAATLCGTDVHFWRGGPNLPDITPYVPGHETCGTVVDMRGPRADITGRALQTGDRIIAGFPTCGDCYHCTVAGQPSLCLHTVIYGHASALHPPHLLGGCAEYHYFPPRADIVRVPENVSAPLAASAACALRTALKAFEQLGDVAPHETVLVQGAGPVGLYATAVARIKGAAQVLVIGAPASRLAIARSFGADATADLDLTDADARQLWAREWTNGRGADVVIQCATAPALVESLQLVRTGGRIASVGIGGGSLSLPGGIFSAKALDLFGVGTAEGRHSYEAIEFLAAHADAGFDRMITDTYDLGGVTDAFEAMANLTAIKPVVIPL